MIEKPRLCCSPSLVCQSISPRSHLTVSPQRQALARADGSGELPMLANSRFAVPEGKTQVVTARSRRA